MGNKRRNHNWKVYIAELGKRLEEIGLEIKIIPLQDKINIIMAVLTFLSVIGVFFTLHEMKIQRNVAYKPSIVMNPVEVTFEWDEFGNEEWIQGAGGTSESTCEVNEDGSITGTIKIPTIFLESLYTTYSVVNIGVGTAKNVVFSWGADNTQKLYDYLILCNPEKEEFGTIGEKSDGFSINDKVVFVDKENTTHLMYMLPEAQETYSIPFPAQYTILINEAIKSGCMNEDVNPYLTLMVKYQDIQGNTQSDLLIILIKRTLYQENEDGSGYASYQLIPAFPSEVVE